MALSRDVEAGSLVGTQLPEKDIVLWRGRGGVVHAWSDRCPHRGMRLSLGFVRGDEIGCAYHGWRFGAEGQCKFIPAQPNAAVPVSLAVARLGCAESAGMVWVSSRPCDTSELADDSGLARSSAPARTVPPSTLPAVGVRSVYIRADLAAVRAELPSLWYACVPKPTAPSESCLAHGSLMGWSVYVGIQMLDASDTAVHISCAADAPSELQVELAIRAAALRIGAEAS